MTNTVKFVWNGIKINREFFKGHYYAGPYTEASKLPAETITIYMRDYKSLPRVEGLNINNDSDIMTDYFETDTVRVFPDSPYYEDARKALKAAEIHTAKRAVAHSEKRLVKMMGTRHEDFYRKELEERKAKLATLTATEETEPPQSVEPTEKTPEHFLLLERRGCDFWEKDDICSRSDVGNHRVFVKFTDKNGVDVCGDLMHGPVYDHTGKKPRIIKDNALFTDFQYEDDNGAWCYHPAVDAKTFTFNFSDILVFMDAISSEHYDAIKFAKRIEICQPTGANFTPSSLIYKYAKESRLETSYYYDAIILHTYNHKYKYHSCEKIEPLSNGMEKVTLLLEEVAQ